MNKDYELPDPKKEPQKCLVLTYKTLKGIQYDNRAWDRMNFGRCMVSASILMGLCRSLVLAEQCLSEMGDSYDSDDITWTLETVARNAHDWLKKKGHLDANASRAGLRMAIAKRQSEGNRQGGMVKASAGPVLGPVRDGKDSQRQDG